MKVDHVKREFFRRLVLLLEERGVGLKQLFDELRLRGVTVTGDGLPDFSLSDAMILLETAVDLSRDPGLMIRVGQQLGSTSYGSFGFALMSSASLRETVRLLLRYGQVLFKPSWTAHEHQGGLILRAQIEGGTAAQKQLLAELSFSNLTTIGRALYGNQIENAEGVELQLSYSRPPHSACYDSAFNVPLYFDCECSQLILPPQILDTPVKTANRSKHVLFQQQCEEILRGLNTVEKTTAAVRQLLIQSAGDFLDIAQVADRLHVSERTLRRRLEVESTSFRSTFDEIRDVLAREYLAETELTVAEIAHLLNYAETVNFRRAFVRWNGMTPSEYRHRMMSEADTQGIIALV